MPLVRWWMVLKSTLCCCNVWFWFNCCYSRCTCRYGYNGDGITSCIAINRCLDPDRGGCDEEVNHIAHGAFSWQFFSLLACRPHVGMMAQVKPLVSATLAGLVMAQAAPPLILVLFRHVVAVTLTPHVCLLLRGRYVCVWVCSFTYVHAHSIGLQNSCRCNFGYRGDGSSCTAINSCTINRGGCHAQVTTAPSHV